MADLIDRQVCIDMFQRMAYDDWNQGVNTTWANALGERPMAWTDNEFDLGLVVQFDADRRMLEAVPSADVQPVRHGHWVFGNTLGHSWMKCSECLVSQNGQTATYTYCPNCGARMNEVE